MTHGLTRAGHRVNGPLPRGYAPDEVAAAEVVLLCVPDREIGAAAAAWRASVGSAGDALLGHCAGATDLSPLRDAAGEGDVFSLHPLMTLPGGDAEPPFAGAAAAIAASSPAALATASELAGDLGLRPVMIADADRVAYHAAASVASNYLVTLLAAAESLAQPCGVSREMLAPLVRATVENWVADGAGALTGPIARGDEATVARQREAVAERTPMLLDLFDALTAATRRIAAPATEIAA